MTIAFKVGRTRDNHERKQKTMATTLLEMPPAIQTMLINLNKHFMKKISTRLHAVLDYAYALVLLAAPWLFTFADIPAAKMIVLISAILVLIVSFLTRYEGGFLKIIPMKVHLWIDVLLGLFLIGSP